MQVPVWVAVCRHGTTGTIPLDEIPRLRKGAELACAFIYRHSQGHLRVRPELLVIDEPRDQAEDFLSGLRWLGDRLPGRPGAAEVGAVFEVCPAGTGTWSWGVVSPEVVEDGSARWFHGKGFAHSDWPLHGHARYPTADVAANDAFGWVFLHEFQHCLDAMYALGGHALGDGDRPWCPDRVPTDDRPNCGHHFSYQAWLLHRFRHFHSLPPQFGRPQPVSEGLQEVTDGRLYDAVLSVSGPLPVSLGRVGTLASAPAFSTDGDLDAQLAAGWDQGGLWLRLRFSQPGRVVIWLDGSGKGWWSGRDNYELVLDLGASRALAKAHAMDVTPELLERNENREAWDDDPSYPFERALEPDYIEVEREGGTVSLKLSPAAARAGLCLGEGQRLGLGVHVERLGPDQRGWASLFQPWALQPLVLAR